MKSVTGAFDTHLALATTTLATCWKVKRIDGRIFAFTDHDIDLPIDLSDGDGALTYKAATGYVRTEIATSGRFNVDDLEVLGVLDSAAITVEDIRGGRYDFAEIKIFLVNWTKISDGPLKLRRGHMGNMTRREETFVAELHGLTQRYIQEVVGLYSAGCRADLGDQPGPSPSLHGCKVQLDPPTWAASLNAALRLDRDAAALADVGSPTPVNVVKPSTFNDRHFQCTTAGQTGASEPSWNLTIGGTTSDGSAVWTTIQALTIEANVATVNSNREFTIDYTGDASEALLTGGLCTFLDTISPSPNNAGLKKEVKQYSVSPPTIVLFLPMPFDIQVGDPVTITAGCDKTLATCRDTFDNILNFRGEPYVPGNDLFFRTPDAH